MLCAIQSLSIEIGDNENHSIPVQIISLDGQMVYSELVNSVDGIIEINGLDHLRAGLYFLRYNIDGLPVVVRLVKG